MPAGYQEDTISAQFVSVALSNSNVPGAGTGTPVSNADQPLGGMQSFEVTFNNPMEVVGGMDGRSRARRTGPYRSDWTASKFLIRKQSLVDPSGGLGVQALQASSIDFGLNYPWQSIVFDITVAFKELSLAQGGTGITANQGAWIVKYCWMTSWRISNAGPYDLMMENVSGIGLGLQLQPWV